MRAKLDAAKYPDVGMFQLDAFLIVTNCCIFNPAGIFHAYHDCAVAYFHGMRWRASKFLNTIACKRISA
jgi:hypothetical protein